MAESARVVPACETLTKPFQLWLPSEGTRSEQRQDPLTEVADYPAGYPQAAAYPLYPQYPASGAFAQEPGRLLRPRV